MSWLLDLATSCAMHLSGKLVKKEIRCEQFRECGCLNRAMHPMAVVLKEQSCAGCGRGQQGEGTLEVVVVFGHVRVAPAPGIGMLTRSCVVL